MPIRQMSLWLTPLLAGALGWSLHASGSSTDIAITAAVTLWCALWWVFEPIPNPATALIPLALFPLLGVLDGKAVAQAYGNPLILLLAGGFMLSRALERSGAHRHLALMMVHAVGGRSGRRLLFGFVLASGVMSMWISNTAATLMLLPVALAAIERYPDPRLAAPLILGIAYAASIGGLGTPIGTPPNLVFMQVYESTTGERMGFLTWMSWGLPIVAVLLPICALWLGRNLVRTPPVELPEVGAWTPAQRRVLAIFALVALCWVTRTEPFGGWSEWLGLARANDASVALLGVVLMCCTPNGEGGRLLDWETAERIPWGALVLFGGGIAIASAFSSSGLSDSLATHLADLHQLPPLLMLLAICAGITLMSEFASNTATAVLLMPVMAAAALAAGVDPALYMLPAALAASCGFMLPVGTAPNAIAYASGSVSSARMLREGAFLDAAGVLVLALAGYFMFA